MSELRSRRPAQGVRFHPWKGVNSQTVLTAWRLGRGFVSADLARAFPFSCGAAAAGFSSAVRRELGDPAGPLRGLRSWPVLRDGERRGHLVDNPDVSSIIRFFIAPDDAAAAGVPRSGTARGLETVELGNFDPVGMLDDWETALLARDADEIVEGGHPVVGGGAHGIPADGGGVLIAMSPDLAADLAEADEARLTEVRARWIQLQSLEGEELDPVWAAELLADIAGLAARASERGHGVYCW